MTDSNRLRDLEEEMTAIREATLAFIRVANSNNETIERLNQAIEQLTTGQQQLNQAIEQLTTGQQQLNQTTEQLTTGQQQLNQTMLQFAANAEADRAEIRKIWEYLLAQQSNGHGRS